MIRAQKPKTLSFCCVVATKEGLSNLRNHGKDVEVFTLAEDPTLDARKFIVPGLGDFGDRFHGTD